MGTAMLDRVRRKSRNIDILSPFNPVLTLVPPRNLAKISRRRRHQRTVCWPLQPSDELIGATTRAQSIRDGAASMQAETLLVAGPCLVLSDRDTRMVKFGARRAIKRL